MAMNQAFNYLYSSTPSPTLSIYNHTPNHHPNKRNKTKSICERGSDVHIQGREIIKPLKYRHHKVTSQSAMYAIITKRRNARD